ncbi:MAG: HlyD family secretion protein [Clostridiales bacterium]|jgi:multidrug efflux pump subunit AcrA (membrane-fusion protein)|nr:HlyD family secretion protein [Clostridiales bacterium]
MNRGVKITGVILFVMFILLIFFSQTIYNYNTPVVIAVTPKNGKLNKTETASGLADWSKTQEVYAKLGGVIEEIYAEEGDRLETGGRLAKVSYDADTVTQQLTVLSIDREKALVSMASSEAGIQRLNQQIQELKKEVYTADDVSDYSLQQAQAKIVQGQSALTEAEAGLEAKRDLFTQAQALYDVGGAALQELDTAQLAVDAAQRAIDTARHNLEGYELDYQNQQSLLSKSGEANAKTLSDKESARQKQIDEWLYQISSAERDLASKRMDIQKYDEQKANYEKQLQDYFDNTYIYAPETGELLSLTLHAGQTVNKGQSLAAMAVGGSYTITCQISLDNNFVAVGDECKLSNTDHTLVSAVSKITPTDKGKTIEIKTDSAEIAAGETFEITFAKESAKSAALIPNGAINKDSDGYYVYMIKKRKGILGDEYYADKVTIYVGDSDDQNTILTQGMMFFEPMVLLSDKPFANGDTIKVKNEGDFFAS